jgi:hypothetical protein
MSEMILLVTEELIATPRLATAIAESNADGAPGRVVLATFTPGRPPAAAIAARLGLVNRSLMHSDAPTVETMLLGACHGIGASRVIVWNCPRAAAAFHALRTLANRPSIEYILPRLGSSPWNETEVIATRVANLVDRFIIEDAATRRQLEEIGIKGGQIDSVRGFSAGPARKESQRIFVLAAQSDRRWNQRIETLRKDGFAVTKSTDAVIVAAARNWGRSAGTIIITDPAFDAMAPIEAAITNGWTVLYPSPRGTEGRGAMSDAVSAHWESQRA